MRLATDDIPPRDEGALRNLVTIQEAQIRRLESERDIAKRDLTQWQKLRKTIDELKELVVQGNQGRHVEELHEKLAVMERINSQLRTQVHEERQHVRDVKGSNDLLRKEATESHIARLDLEKTLVKEKTRFSAESERLATRIKELDDDNQFLNTTLDEMEKRIKDVENEQKWTEAQLASCSEHVQELLSEITLMHDAKQGLEKEAATAFLRGSRMNKDLRDKAHAEYVRAKAREASLLDEIASLKKELRAQLVLSKSTNKASNVDRNDPPQDTGNHKVQLAQNVSRSTHSGDPGVWEEDPRVHMTPGGVLEDMFRGLSSKAPDPVVISEVLGIRNMVIVEPADFVWASCPDVAYFVKPALFHGKGRKWQDSKLKSIRRLQKQSDTGVEIVPHFSGAYYYVGTYVVGDAEPMSAEQFEQLPEATQRGVIGSSGKPAESDTLRVLYLSGKLSAIRFPVRRIGFNHQLHRYLRLSA